ncbi:MAG: hypothetical protein H7239_08980 [Flavobacterium sp.]|nr:hypothetical protein [Flavobacterium sp.]
MKANKIALIIYFTTCFLATLACIFDNETLMLVSRPIIIPALFFYYFVTSKKLNYLLISVLGLYFIVDGIGLMNFENEIKYIMAPFFIANILVTILCLKNIEKFKFKVFTVASLLFLALILGYLWITIIELFNTYDANIQNQVIIFGASLFLQSFIIGYKIIHKITFSNLSVMMFGTLILISDLFYLMYNFEYQSIILNSTHFGSQMVSYFFLVQFEILNNKQHQIIS